MSRWWWILVALSLAGCGGGGGGGGGSGTNGAGGAEVAGAVTAAGTGSPIAGARVLVFSPALDFFRETRTDAAGQYTVPGVPPGAYRIAVVARGREYQEDAITVAAAPVGRSFALGPETHGGRWTVVASTLQYLDGTGSGNLTIDGKVFFCHDTRDPDLFDPETNTTRPGRDSLVDQGCHIVTLNTDGLLFFAGGSNGGDPDDPVSRTVKTYDSRTDSWSGAPADMAIARWYPMLVRLPDERLLVMGGELDGAPARTASCEIYDPVANAWSPADDMGLPTEIAPAAVLYTGKVLRTWRFPELYDIAGDAWTPAAAMQQGRAGAASGDHCDHTIVVLGDGRVMALGLLPLAGNPLPTYAELYDPVANAWTRGPNPRHIRSRPEAIVLPDGRVLSFGGQYVGLGTASSPPARASAGSIPDCTNVADLYDPATNAWRPLADLNRFIHYHNVTVLVPDGRVIATGGAGGASRVFGDDGRIEAFEPPYLFRGPRPRIDTISTAAARVGDAVTLTVSRAKAVTEVVLVGAHNSTHWGDAGPQRCLSIPFTQSGARVDATIPNDAARALPGVYILFALVDDVPSEGKIVSIRAR